MLRSYELRIYLAHRYRAVLPFHNGVRMIEINEKPLSVNKAWLGRKRKSKDYRMYEVNMLEALPDLEIPEGKLKLTIHVYYSSRASDIDNCLKPFIDILQKRYDFDDKWIYKLHVEKFVVKRGFEKICFEVELYEDS